ncbi:hypothetical protein JOE48_001287 [Methylobacterium sp. PvR107]|nr:hypothetical protein [Methylobacterium sp. PvR107]
MEIVAFLASTAAGQVTRLVVTNPFVVVTGDRASLSALVEAVHIVRNAPDRRFRMMNRCEASLERRVDGWAIGRLRSEDVGSSAILERFRTDEGTDTRLEHAFDATATVLWPHVVGPGPFGMRHSYEVEAGLVDGPLLAAPTLGASADWLLGEPDGVMRVDVRIQIVTDDGAVLCDRCRGIGEPTERMRTAMELGEPTGFEDRRIRTCWELECGAPRYAGVNRCIMVVEARCRPAERPGRLSSTGSTGRLEDVP